MNSLLTQTLIILQLCDTLFFAALGLLVEYFSLYSMDFTIIATKH